MATTTPNYGWDVPTSTDYVKDGATAIETLGDDIDATLFTALGGAYPGLRLVKKQTIGTGVTSATVTSCFSATYEAYRIVITGGTASGTNPIYLKMGVLATNEALYQNSLIYAPFAGGAVANGAGANASNWPYAGTAAANGLAGAVDLINPFLAKNTAASSRYHDASNAGNFNGYLNTTNSYTDLTIGVTSGTITGGTIYVYGYGIS
jgi:hypothetical protein